MRPRLALLLVLLGFGLAACAQGKQSVDDDQHSRFGGFYGGLNGGGVP